MSRTCQRCRRAPLGLSYAAGFSHIVYDLLQEQASPTMAASVNVEVVTLSNLIGFVNIINKTKHI